MIVITIVIDAIMLTDVDIIWTISILSACCALSNIIKDGKIINVDLIYVI